MQVEGDESRLRLEKGTEPTRVSVASGLLGRNGGGWARAVVKDKRRRRRWGRLSGTRRRQAFDI